MKIYSILGVQIADVPVQSNAEHERELMKSDFIRLEWSQSSFLELPCGSYIEYDGVKYRLLKDYKPEQQSTQQWDYSPEFQHPVMMLGTIPFILVTGDTTSWQSADKETEWSWTGMAVNAINEVFVPFLNKYGADNVDIGTGWTAVVSTDIKASETLTFQSMDFLSALSHAAQQFECEWHLDYENKILYFGHINITTEELVFEVGKNIGNPEVRENNEGYYNAYIAKGSTRNISQVNDKGENIQLNKRLKLDPIKYPDGYIDRRKSAEEPLIVKELIYEDIYPSLDLYIYNPKARTRFLLDSNTGEKIKDDTDPTGYKRYSIWYVRLAYKLNGEWKDFEFSKDMLIGNLSCQFQANENSTKYTSPLAGREFELTYHDSDQIIPADPITGDTGITIKKGDYEIIYDENNGLIIPTTVEGGMYPRGDEYQSEDNNILRLYNIALPLEYTSKAQEELETQALKDIAYWESDRNNYEFNSNPIAFKADMPKLFIGRGVVYKNGDYQLNTRISKLVQKIDFPYEVEITVGNEEIKGSTTTMREQLQMVVSAMSNGMGGMSVEQFKKMLNIYATSMFGNRFLSKLNDDVAAGVITFLRGLISKAKSIFQEGIEIGNFVTGWLGGSGAAIDKDGNAEFESIKARGFIETPELRFNRIDVVSGELWNSICFGTIERVDTDRRKAYLKLEEGELSGIKVDDICRGIFHSVKGGNAIKERLDECNFIELAGFATSYFTPIEVYENGASFKYSLKPGTTVHPQAGMKFAVYGNFTDKSRQASAYQTRTYQRYLNKVDTWVIDPGKNIYMQLGLLDGLVINGYQLKDYGALMHNVYLSGVHIDFDRDFIESITPNVYSLHLTKTNFVVITDLEGNVIDGIKDTGNVTADDTTEQANVTANTNTDTDFDNVTVGNMYLMRSVIQVYNGDTPLLYSEHIDEGTFIAELTAYGCTANAKNGVVTITDIDTSAEKIYVDVKVNCEGNIHLTKRIDVTVLTEPENGVTADLDNEMTTLPSDDKGNVFAFDPIKVVPRLWYGNNPMAITRAYVEKLPDGITTNVQLVTESGYSYYEIPLVDGVRTLIISGVSQSAADVNELLIAVEGKINSSCTNTYTKNAVFKLNKAKMGENAIRYELVPSTNEIIVDKDGNVKTSAVSCQVIEMDGKSTTTLTTAAQMSARGLTAKVRIYNASATGSEVGYTISSNVSIGSAYGGQTFSKDTIKAVFTLYHNGTLIDKEGVPVIRNGVYAVRIDLDNENDTMLYNGLGALVSGNVISHATLFDGTTNVNSAVSEWSMQGSTGCTASVNSNTITVTAMSANTGSVTIGAKYLGNIYTAVLTLKKLVGVDKYEIVTTPTAVTKAPNTGKYSHASITVDVYVTRQNGTREKNPDMGGATLSNNITGGMTPGDTFLTSSFGSNKQVVFTVTRNGVVEDSETIPLLEAGLNGKKRIVIQPQGGGTRSYTYAQWETWGAYGHSETWGCSNASDIVVGDTGVIVGYVSDRGNISATIEGIVTSKTDTQVVMTSLVLTVKGDDGKDAEYDVIEVIDNTVTIGLTGAATGYIKWRTIHIKGSTRKEASVGASSHKIILNGQETNGYNGTEGNIAIYTFGVNGEQKLSSSGFTLKYVASTGGAVLVVQAAKAGESYFPVNRGILESGNTYHYAQNATTGIWERDFGMYPIGDAYYYFMVKNKNAEVKDMPTQAGDDDNWILMSRYKAVLADTLIGKNCNIGGFLASEEYFVSESKVKNPSGNTIYDIHNIVLDGKNGKIIGNDCKIRGEVNATSGTFENCKITNNCKIEPQNKEGGGWFLRGGKDGNGVDKGAAAWWLGYTGSLPGQFTMESEYQEADYIPAYARLSFITPRITSTGSDGGAMINVRSNISHPLASFSHIYGTDVDICPSEGTGIQFSQSSAVKTPIAFKGSGHGVLNGVIQGYKLNTMSSGVIKITNGNTVYCSGKGTSLYLPELAECKSVLGTTGAFALDLCIVGAKGASDFTVKGSDYSTLTDCKLVGNDHQAWYATMSEGDVLMLKLIYNGSTFYAYVVSHMN